MRSNGIKLVVIHNYSTWLNLTENWIYNQVYYLPEHVENHIVCKSTVNLERFSLPNIHCFSQASVGTQLRVFTYGLWRLGRRFRRHAAFLAWVARREKAIIMHSHFGYTGWRYAAVAKQAGLKHVVTFYGVDISRLPKEDAVWLRRYREMFSLVDCVLCEGPHLANCVLEFGCPEHKVRVHRLGVRIDEIPYRPRQWNQSEPLRVLIAASFREKKGIPYALRALGLLQKSLPLEITIIGDAGRRSQEEKRTIIKTIEEFNLGPKVRLLGYQPFEVMLQEAYSHHVFLSPSVTAGDGDTEGGAPVSIIEMAASGMPVVSTRHCDIPEIIQNGKTGLLAEERDVNGLFEHLEWLVDKPREWRPMVEAARRRVEEQFNVGTQGEKLAAIYQEVAEQ